MEFSLISMYFKVLDLVEQNYIIIILIYFSTVALIAKTFSIFHAQNKEEY